MEIQSTANWFSFSRLLASRLLVMALGMFAAFAAAADPLTVNVYSVPRNGVVDKNTPILSYRWAVELDATKPSVPGVPATKENYSFSFHRSYMPLLAAGRAGTAALDLAARSEDPDVQRLAASLPDLDASKRYYVNIAAEGHQMGGAPVVFKNGQATAEVYLNQYKLPTAQLSVYAFEDNNPINGAPDLPQEGGLAGFTVQLYEAGGTYGASGGRVTQDAFANPLGTTYLDEDGTVNVRGSGIILTGPDGTATIKNLFPAKYTVIISAPVGTDWTQTSTIEGTKGSDAWVKNNEPTFFQEFGPPGHHVFIGFVKSGKLAKNGNGTFVLNGGKTLTGQVINIHNSRTPNYKFENGAPVNDCRVGLNEAGAGRALYAGACKKDSSFEIPDVPPGTYELVVWDEPLDMIIGTSTITVPSAGGATHDLGKVPVFSWFGRYQGRVFQDIDGTGLPFFENDFSKPYIEVDPKTGLEHPGAKTFKKGDLKPSFGEGIGNNIRFRDGSIYQSVTTKTDGTFAFTELFPFFNWMVAEIDYARFKASGATMVVDDGGFIDPVANQGKLWAANPGLFGTNDPSLKYNPWIRLNPQEQKDGKFYRNENCEGGGCAILLEGMQTFLGQTNHIEWGKQPYGFNENGGIAGIVHYAITRAEDDPRFAAAENWEPGIPRVQVNMYLDCDGDSIPDKPKNDGSGACLALSTGNYGYDKADVDNYPFCWRDEDFVKENPDLCPDGIKMGAEDDKRSRTGGAEFSYGDVFKWGTPGGTDADQVHTALSKTDAWDDSLPEGCVKATAVGTVGNGGIVNPLTEQLDCFDGLYNFNQLRPSVFDGGYAFGRVAGQAELPMLLGNEGKGTYIIEAVAPPGYLHQGNGDKNVTFGDELRANTAALPFECVGQDLPVPAELTLFPGQANPNYEAGQRTWRKCDMKAVALNPGTNPAPDFYMFTEAPVSGHGVGFILDDTASEFNRFAPTFGEKYAPPHLPVSVQDWTGREISRVYSDQFGSYNFLVPSTFTINPPYPSGVMPSMMVSCMNHPGPVKIGVNEDGSDKMGIDPYFNRKYTQFCYTLQYLPGKTTYLDTPVLPISAFASVEKNPLDCECQNQTPAIYSVNNNEGGNNYGPWIDVTKGGKLTIVSTGKAVEVPNPAFDPANPASPRKITRDYGFGPQSSPGTVKLGNTVLTLDGDWNDEILVVNVPIGTPSGQLTITRGDSLKESVVGLTVHVDATAPITVQPGKSIQAAIDAAANGALITIPPGTYNEYLIVDKRVRLQGWGADSVTINAAKQSAGGLQAWRDLLNTKIDAVVDTNTPDPDTGKSYTVNPGPKRTFDILPGQTLGINSPNNEPIFFGAEEGPGILAVGKQDGNGCLNSAITFSIDGLTVTGSDSGGGILASGYTCGLQVSNNRLTGNYGTYGGGVRIGHTVLANGDTYTDGVNPNVKIHHNWIAQNGATEDGGGGGVTLGTGASDYVVNNNYVCGNFSMADGGGISHFGRSNGTIKNNQIIFNQTFNQSADPTGGGLFVGGQVSLGGGQVGVGNVLVDANVIQYNHAGAGAGGGVSVALTTQGDSVMFTNNMIVNNAAAFAGGGVALTSARGVSFVNNTIASNVSTATNRQSFPTGEAQKQSIAQVAGLAVVNGNSPTLLNNILWNNKSYVWKVTADPQGGPDTFGLIADVAKPIWDLGRLNLESGPGFDLTPQYSILSRVTNNSGYLTQGQVCAPGNTNLTQKCNIAVATTSTNLFVKNNDFQFATDPDQPGVLPETTIMTAGLTFDEGGNYINVLFNPLTLWEVDGKTLRGDYHIRGGSPAQDKGHNRTNNDGGNGVPNTDFEGDLRPQQGGPDIGADEVALIRVTPTSIDFGKQQINTTSTVRTITLTNLQGTALSIGNITLTGANSNQFLLSPVHTCGTSLIGNGSCTISVVFKPTSLNTKVASINLVTGVGTQPIALSGNSVAPQGTLSPSSLAFGSQLVNTTSAAKTFTLKNTGYGPLVVSNVGLIQLAAGFAQTNNCVSQSPLAVGASCTISVTFRPTSTGNKGATATVTAANGSVITPGLFNIGAVTLSGAGGNTSTWGNGGTVGVWGGNGGARSITFTNFAQTTMNLGTGVAPSPVPVVVTGAQFAIVTAGTTCTAGKVLAYGESCTVTVNRTRPNSGNRSGNGTLTINGTGGLLPAQVLNLSGN